MKKTNELSRLFLAWFAARRRVREWVENKSMADADSDDNDSASMVDPAEFVELRRRSYALEWELLNHPATREAWETALHMIRADEPDWQQADELRRLRNSIEMLPPTSVEGQRGMKVAGWWFIPMAAWVGKQPKEGPLSEVEGDHAMPQLNLIRSNLHQRLSKSIPEIVGHDAVLAGMKYVFLMQITPFLNPEGLRSDAFLSGNFESLGKEQRAPFEMRPNPDNPLRSACLGIYLAAPDYQTLATIRDLLLSQLDHDLEEASGEQVRFGSLKERAAAVDEAELLSWDLWVEEVLDAPLAEGADLRQVVLTVTRKEGVPVRMEGRYLDLNTSNHQVLDTALMACRLDTDDRLLYDALEPFVANQRTDVFWSVHSLSAD